MIKKTITITKKQAAWIEEKTLNLSKFIRKCIDEAIAKDRNVLK